jgi:hypothetical protein
MAQLPPDGEWIVQHIGDRVVLFHRHTEKEIASAQADDGDAIAKVQSTIHKSPELTPEQRAMAHFWFGYFYGYAVSFGRH